MRRRTLVFFVCSPHSRTGVTTAARLLTDYYLSRGVAVEGFDTDSREPRYAEWFPQRSQVIDVNDVKGQITLFDRLLLCDETPKIVDVWSRSYDRLFSTIAEIGYFEEARQSGVLPVILYQVDATQSTANSALSLVATWPELWITAIQNEGAAPLGFDAHDILSLYPTRGKFVIPALEGPIAKALEDPYLSLTDFLQDPPQELSIVVRAALKGWILPIFTQIQSFQLRLDLQSSEFLR